MSTRIKYFRDGNQARDTRTFLNTRGLKSYIRDRSTGVVEGDKEAFGYDLFALRDEDVEEARTLLDYEFGTGWGENQD